MTNFPTAIEGPPHRSARHRPSIIGWPLAALLAVTTTLTSATVPPAWGVAEFGDVEANRFYTEAVQWMVDNDITTGVSATCFAPEENVTRGQAATFMFRMEGSPEGSQPHGFVDVSGDYQEEPISWMSARGITTGTTATTFSPDRHITRGELAALLHRLAGSPAANGPGFPDVVRGWQIVPVTWMVDHDITTGTTPTTFSPDAYVTRGQLAAFFHRYKGSPGVVVDPASPACGPSGNPDELLLQDLAALIGNTDPTQPAYVRADFGYGSDLDGDCVDTRHEVLQEEAVSYVMSGCSVVSGEWYDPFTGQTFFDPTDLEVDHVVALSDAWYSGAWSFGADAKRRLGNDVDNLNAIRSAENQAKGNLGPALYTPSNGAHACEYVRQYSSVKVKWNLSITRADYEASASTLADCGATPPPNDPPGPDCHPAYIPCLPNAVGDAYNCGDLDSSLKPVTVVNIGFDPYGFDGDSDGVGCESG